MPTVNSLEDKAERRLSDIRALRRAKRLTAAADNGKAVTVLRAGATVIRTTNPGKWGDTLKQL